MYATKGAATGIGFVVTKLGKSNNATHLNKIDSFIYKNGNEVIFIVQKLLTLFIYEFLLQSQKPNGVVKLRNSSVLSTGKD